MKYLLILLFLFSTHSYSGELDGKGLYCRLKDVDKYYGKGFYTHRYSAFIFKSSKYKRWTIEVNKNNRTVKIHKTKRKAYYTTVDTVNLSPYGLLNRKNLQLTGSRCEPDDTDEVDAIVKCIDPRTKEKHTVKVTSQCTAYTDIKKLEKKIKSEMSWVKQNIEDEYNKKSKENKI